MAIKASVAHERAADGLRGLGALSVAISHFFNAFFPSILHYQYPWIFKLNVQPGAIEQILQFPLLSVFYNGHAAVMVFFILSGAVLGLPDQRGDREALVRRFWGRYLRLNIPIAVSILISFLFIVFNLYQNVGVAELSGSEWFASFFKETPTLGTLLQLVTYQSLIGGDASLNPPLWSLKVEFLGSLLLLAFLCLRPRSYKLGTLLALIFLVFVCVKDQPLYIISILSGTLLVRLEKTKYTRWLALVAGLVGLYFCGFSFEQALYGWLPLWQNQDNKVIYNFVGAFLLVGGVLNSAFHFILESKWVQFLGRISYSLYLTHFLVLSSISCFLYPFMRSSGLPLVVDFALFLLALILSSLAFERWVDRPAIRISHRFTDWLLKIKKN